MLMRFDRDWYSVLPDLTGNDKKAATKARATLRDAVATAYHLYPSCGTPLLLEHTFVNPYDHEEDFTLRLDDALGDVRSGGALEPALGELGDRGADHLIAAVFGAHTGSHEK